MVCFVNQAFTKLNILKRFKNVVQKFGGAKLVPLHHV